MARRKRNTNLVDVVLDEKSFNAAIKRIKKYEGRDFRGRVIAAFIGGARLLVAPMRRIAPRRTGALARSIKAKLAKQHVVTSLVRVNVKPRAPKGAHGHLHSKGHRIFDFKGNPTGGYYEGTGFVQRTIDAHEGRVIKFMQEQPLDIEGANLRGFGSGLRNF